MSERYRADALLDIMEDHSEMFFASLRYVAERLLAELKELPEEALNLQVGDIKLRAVQGVLA